MECSKILRILFLTGGRALFASYFIISSWQQLRDLGTDGGPTARYLAKRFDYFFQDSAEVADILVHGLAFTLCGGIYFVLGIKDKRGMMDTELCGIIVLFLHQVIAIPLMYDFYNYKADSAEYAQLSMYFMLNLALLGAILVMIGHRIEIPMKPKNVPEVQASNVPKVEASNFKEHFHSVTISEDTNVSFRGCNCTIQHIS